MHTARRTAPTGACINSSKMLSAFPSFKAPLPKDDPTRRKPDIGRAQELLGGWSPQIPLEKGLAATIDDFKKRLGL